MTESSRITRADLVNTEELFNWLEQQDELEYLRARAAGARCEYSPAETHLSRRIKESSSLELPRKSGWLRAVLDQIWVPAANMRGKAYATPELDKSLNSVAKLMCIGTLWDFFTTIPIFQFSLAGPLTVLSFPAAIALSYILLISSNYAGENSTNRSRGNGWMATMSLSAFLILCTTKTVFSGVGIDLWIGSRGIASRYAAELAATKLASDRKVRDELEAGGNDYKAAKKNCDELEQQMNALDRNAEDKKFTSLFVKAYGTFGDKKGLEGLTAQQLKKRYGSVTAIPGVCKQAGVLLEMSKEAARPLSAAIDRKAVLVNQMPPLAYLEKHEPDIYREHFKVVNGEFRWVNGTEAVGQATKQFYESLFRGEFGLLGFSLFTLAVSVILTGASAIMLYVISRNIQVKASFTGELETYRNNILTDYDAAVERHLNTNT